MKKIDLNSREVFGSYRDPEYFFSEKEDYDAYWEWPENLGFGYMGAMDLRPGLILRVGRFKIMEDLSISYDPYNSYISFRFALKGSAFFELNLDNDRNEFLFDSGTFFVSYLPGWEGKVTYNSETAVDVVGIGISPELFASFTGENFEQMPQSLKGIIESERTEYSCHYNCATSNEVASLLKEILYCPYTGPMRKIFLEGKALELFATAMIHISKSGENKVADKGKGPDSADREKMYEVKRILEENLQNPPSLVELSRKVGISHPKLSLCFKNVYGKTVFEYLRELRVKRARLLLDEGSLNITEVADVTGYSSPSYFTRSFKNYFGLNPGEYLRKGI